MEELKRIDITVDEVKDALKPLLKDTLLKLGQIRIELMRKHGLSVILGKALMYEIFLTFLTELSKAVVGMENYIIQKLGEELGK